MNLHNNLLICPHLTGSEDGVLCRVIFLPIRDIGDIDLDICMSGIMNSFMFTAPSCTK